MSFSKPVPRFKLGTLVATPGVLAVMSPEDIGSCICSHLLGQWGEVDAHDKQANEDALRHGDRLLSVYPMPKGTGKVWVITEADRSSTTVLLPEEY